MVFKTDWKITDFFNASDFNMLKSNIEELYKFSLKLYRKYDIIDIKSANISDVELIDMLNAVESDVDIIANNTFRSIKFVPSYVQLENSAFWDFEDLNRIGKNLNDIYNALVSAEINKDYIPMILGVGIYGYAVSTV